MSRIDLHRWQSAQTAEFGHHQDLRMSAYSIATKTIGNLLGIDYEYSQTQCVDQICVQMCHCLLLV